MVQWADDTFERGLRAGGAVLLVGLDECGRGAWASDLCVGAVATTADGQLPAGLADSKLLAAPARRRLDGEVRAAVDAAVGSASAAEVDAWGVTVALRVAARRAVAELVGRLGREPDALVLDGPHDYVSGPVPFDALELAGVADGLDVHTLVRGDASCSLLAAASVVAKVHRDAVLERLDGELPGWGFAEHMGYPTPAHRDAVARLGLSPQHRRTWRH